MSVSNPPQVGWGWYGIELHHFLESGVLDALNSLSYNGKGGRSSVNIIISHSYTSWLPFQQIAVVSYNTGQCQSVWLSGRALAV